MKELILKDVTVEQIEELFKGEKSVMFSPLPRNKQYVIGDNAVIINQKLNRIVKGTVDKTNNRRRHRFSGKGNGIKNTAVYIAQTFHSQSYFEGAEADHIDDNKRNDHARNLQWLSKGDNVRKAHQKNTPIKTIVDQ